MDIQNHPVNPSVITQRFSGKTDAVSQPTPAEIQALDSAFKNGNGLAYVVNNLKPACMASIDPHEAEALQKVLSSKFAFLSNGPNRFTNKTDFMLLNKPECKKLIEANLEEFQTAFPNARDANEVLEAIQNDNISLLRQNYLIGIFLGYGKNNSRLYAQMVAADPRFSPTGGNPEEYSRLSKQLREISIGKGSSFENGLKIGFAADLSDPETTVLQQKYEQAFQEMSSLLRQPDGVYKLISAAQQTN